MRGGMTVGEHFNCGGKLGSFIAKGGVSLISN